MTGIIKDYLEQAHAHERADFIDRNPNPVLIRQKDTATPDPRNEYRSTLKMRVDMETREVKVEPFPPSPTDEVIVLTKSEQNSFPSKVLVGRTETNDVVIPHLAVSKHHAYIRLDEEASRFTITDTGSTNGTEVNGQAIQEKEPRYLSDGDQVAFGDARFTFYTAGGFYDLLTSLSVLV
jgi:pSer/pThr/pTyr-binding forkhead associated (FHA) protein